MEGGYQILNLGRINLTSTAKKVPGAYDYIEKNLQHKVVLLEGLKLDGKLYDSIFTTFAKSYGNYIGTFTIDAKLYSVVISADDLVHTKRLIPVGDDTIELVEAMIADPWESDEVYSQGDRVTRKHSLYELTADTSTGDPPESNPGKWKKVTVGSGGAGIEDHEVTENSAPELYHVGPPGTKLAYAYAWDVNAPSQYLYYCNQITSAYGTYLQIRTYDGKSGTGRKVRYNYGIIV